MSRKPPATSEQFPVSFYETRTLAGYSYRRLVGTRLRKVRGRKRRVRYNVYSLVTVPPRERLVWVTILPAPVARKAKVKAPPADKWYNVADYQRALLAQKEMDGETVEEIENQIFHSDPDGDWINAAHLFVWGKPVLPTKIRVFKRDRPFRMVRIWFLVFHKSNATFRLWCRSSVVDESNYAEARAFAVGLHAQVTEDLQDQFSYIEVRELCAWTAYRLNERATRRDRRRSEKIGGS